MLPLWPFRAQCLIQGQIGSDPDAAEA
jgi:hypothetical protein